MHFEIARTACVVDREARVSQMASAMQRGLPVCTIEKPHKRKVSIVATGPSVNDYLDELREFDGEIWALNGGHDYLIERGIKPTAFACIDPLDWLSDYLRNPIHGVTYYVASVCHPDVFDALSGHDVRIWHLKDADDNLPGAVPGGTTCVTRVPYLALCLGFRDIRIYGCDSSFTETKHSYGDGYERPDPEIVLNVGGKEFKTEAPLFHQVSELGAMQELFAERYPFVNLEFRCGGLAEHWLKQPIVPLEQIEGP